MVHPKIIRTSLCKAHSLVCMTTPCPTAGWPPVMWKGSGVRVPCRSPSQAARAPARGLLPDCASDLLAGLAGRRDPSPSAQETTVVQVQPDRRAKMKEPSFHYMA
ncbi:unnamed protein product [Spirodela intermedia]|uniref:Uncharacterized protein n=1 Tax=Spirodela intermedia TaxID=51605 RepID=A0A7I8LCS1_SPIIN|nr:unnamed protein product [Spirodela intermedia]